MREFLKQYLIEKQVGYLQSGRFERVDWLRLLSSEYANFTGL